MSADAPTADDLVRATAFVGSVIFKPWRKNGVGPDAYSCWGLARAAELELAGIALPLIDTDADDVRAVVRAIRDSPLRAEWHEVSHPRHLDLVSMTHSRQSHHIGVYLELDGGGVLHACKQFDAKGEWAPQKPAVAFAALHVLPLEGWVHQSFLRHQGARP